MAHPTCSRRATAAPRTKNLTAGIGTLWCGCPVKDPVGEHLEGRLCYWNTASSYSLRADCNVKIQGPDHLKDGLSV